MPDILRPRPAGADTSKLEHCPDRLFLTRALGHTKFKVSFRLKSPIFVAYPGGGVTASFVRSVYPDATEVEPWRGPMPKAVKHPEDEFI